MKRPGESVGRYVVEALLGRGGMGEVYEASDPKLGRRVALKLIVSDTSAEGAALLVREARAAAAFEHPNAVVIYDVGEHEGAPFIAMELVRGAPLRRHVGDAAVPSAKRLRWLVDVARTLAAAHAAGLVHRDIKPDNVMVRDDGAIKVLDFGIARRSVPVDPSAPTETPLGQVDTLSGRGGVVGTPLYAAPEQLRGERVDGRADQFSWGVLAYELLSGRLPWAADDAVTALAQVLSAEPPPLTAAGLPRAVEAVVARALAKKAEGRFDSLDEAADALEPFAEPPRPTGRLRRSTPRGAAHAPAVPTAPPSVSGPQRARPPARPLPALVAFGAAAALSAAGALVWVKARGGPAGGQAAAPDPGLRTVGCAPAKLTGAPAPAGEALSRAVGVGACARLAVELGAAWGEGAGPERLEVRGKVGDGETSLTLEIDGQRGAGKGPTPLAAISAAVADLAPRLRPPPLDEARVRLWDAKDEASARRTERLWRSISLRLRAGDDSAAVARLLEADPDSIFLHLMAINSSRRGTDQIRDEVAALRGRLERRPRLEPGRKLALRASLDAVGSDDWRQILGLYRQAYRESPDDSFVAGSAALTLIGAGAADEGYAILDRFSERAPTEGLHLLAYALSDARMRAPERARRYADRLVAAFPEALGWSDVVNYLATSGQTDAARSGLALARRFGAADPSSYAASRAALELAALAPAAAREAAAILLGDPRQGTSNLGAGVIAQSFLLEGRVGEAQAAMAHEVERQKGLGSSLFAVRYWAASADLGRLFGRPPPPAADLAWAREVAAREPLLSTPQRLRLRALALALEARGPRAAAARAELARLEADATRLGAGDRAVTAELRLKLLPAVRALRGAAPAAELWRLADAAPFDARQQAAFEAALALESGGDAAAAERVYEIAEDRDFGLETAFGFAAARLRHAALLRKQGRAEAAAQLDAELAKLWGAAEPGLREAVLALK